MTTFVIFDPIVNGYLKSLTGKPTKIWQQARQYKRLLAAISPDSGAGLLNTERNLPPGQTTPCRYYQNLPNVEVHEYDDAGNFVKIHAAPPSYYHVVT